MPREQASYHCNMCKDHGFIFKEVNGYEAASKCKCKLKEEILSKSNNSGLGDLFETRTFETYTSEHDYQRIIKEKAINYTKEFIRGNRSSFAILGQSGIGKTHIMTAIAGKLIDNNIQVKYYIADEIVQRLNACKYDEENYNKEFSSIANSEVLLIDDLFKSSIQNFYSVESINKEDLRVMFQIINYRYNKNKPILLSSEIHYERFGELDQAIIGRINEMCKYEYLISIKPDKDKNYRLNRKAL